MFKLALVAGHYLYTDGKRCDKSLDPKQTREWWLNDRVVDKIEKILAEYDGIEILRIDDTTGKVDIPLADRTDKANEWGADFYLSIHHNAANKVFSGGGIVAYVYTNASAASVEWQKALYNAAIEYTGLKGNRATPLAKANLHEVREPQMPAVLMECGFMDSTVDVPIILTEDYADKLAKAFAEVIIKRSGATKKISAIYRVQVGAFRNEKYAEAYLAKIKKAGFADAFIAKEGGKEEVEKSVSKPILKKGSKGDDVKDLQRILNALGYTDSSKKALTVDGSFGNATLYALKAFQKAKGLDIDGSCGEKTWAALRTAVLDLFN